MILKQKVINYSFSVNDNIATIQTLNLETSLIEVKRKLRNKPNSKSNLHRWSYKRYNKQYTMEYTR